MDVEKKNARGGGRVQQAVKLSLAYTTLQVKDILIVLRGLDGCLCSLEIMSSCDGFFKAFCRRSSKPKIPLGF